jgi:hypothetical protein
MLSGLFHQKTDSHNALLLKNKIYIPKTLRKEIQKCKHMILHYPRIARTEKYIKFHSTWPRMRTGMD